LPRSFGNKAALSSSLDYVINGKGDLKSFKIEQTNVVPSLNKNLGSLKELPLCTTKLSQKKYPKEKFQKIKGVMKGRIFNSRDSNGSYGSGEDETNQLRETFHMTGRKSKKVQMLTHLPKLTQDLKVHGSDCQKIRPEKGILSSLNVKPNKVLPPERAAMVKQFYSFDKVNIMPRTRNCFC
jgi:hypothetical protein